MFLLKVKRFSNKAAKIIAIITRVGKLISGLDQGHDLRYFKKIENITLNTD